MLTGKGFQRICRNQKIDINYIMKKKPDIEKVKLLNNPFCQGLVINVTKKWDSDKKVYDEGILIDSNYLLEKKLKTSVYRDKDYKKLILGLSNSGIRVYTYIIYSLDRNEDYIWLDKQNLCRDLSMKSINTLNSGLEELMINKIIVPTGIYKDVYWINPDIFFCGNRVNKYPKNIKVVQVIE